MKSEHHFILIYRLNKSFYYRLCLCFRFQGKTEPPTGQIPAKNIDAKQETRQVYLRLQKILDKTENQPEQDYTLDKLLSAFSSGRCGRMGPANMEHGITSGVRRGWEIWGYIGNAMLSPSDIGLSITMDPLYISAGITVKSHIFKFRQDLHPSSILHYLSSINRSATLFCRKSRNQSVFTLDPSTTCEALSLS